MPTPITKVELIELVKREGGVTIWENTPNAGMIVRLNIWGNDIERGLIKLQELWTIWEFPEPFYISTHDSQGYSGSGSWTKGGRNLGEYTLVENKYKTLTGEMLMGMIFGDEVPHKAFLKWVEAFDPELAKELREQDKDDESD